MDLFFWLDDFLRSRTPRAGWSVYAIESLRVFVLILSTALLVYILVDSFHVQLHLPAQFVIPCVGVAVLANVGIYLANRP